MMGSRWLPIACLGMYRKKPYDALYLVALSKDWSDVGFCEDYSP
jgi:hypothetical protein